MDVEHRHEIEARIREISAELGLLEPSDLTSCRLVSEHELEEIEALRGTRTTHAGPREGLLKTISPANKDKRPIRFTSIRGWRHELPNRNY